MVTHRFGVHGRISVRIGGHVRVRPLGWIGETAKQERHRLGRSPGARASMERLCPLQTANGLARSTRDDQDVNGRHRPRGPRLWGPDLGGDDHQASQASSPTTPASADTGRTVPREIKAGTSFCPERRPQRASPQRGEATSRMLMDPSRRASHWIRSKADSLSPRGRAALILLHPPRAEFDWGV
jgi:hypothetical protein